MSDPEVVFLERDNAIDLVLLADGTPVDLGVLTRAVLDLGEASVDSQVSGWGAGQPFDHTVTGTYQGAAADVLRLSLGALGLTPGSYRARLITYDADHPNGLVWASGLPVVVTS